MAVRRAWRLCIIAGVIASLAAACVSKLTVPPGAQAVHLTMDDAGIHLDPDTVHAGDVYLVIDTFGAEPVLIQESTGDAGEQALSEERLRAVLRGEAYRISISSGFASGGEPYGNVNLLELTPGVHMFATRDPTGGAYGPGDYTLLTVTP